MSQRAASAADAIRLAIEIARADVGDAQLEFYPPNISPWPWRANGSLPPEIDHGHAGMGAGSGVRASSQEGFERLSRKHRRAQAQSLHDGDRIKYIMGQPEGTTFNRTLVRLNTEELAVVTKTHPEDPFLPQVTLIIGPKGEKLETPLLTNTWERDARGVSPHAVIEGGRWREGRH